MIMKNRTNLVNILSAPVGSARSTVLSPDPSATGVLSFSDQRDEIFTLHNELTGLARTSLAKAQRIGELLVQVRESLDHGAWLPWLKANVPFTDRTARRYIRVYEHRDQIKLDTVSDLSSAYWLLTESTQQEPDNGKLATAEAFAQWGQAFEALDSSPSSWEMFTAAYRKWRASLPKWTPGTSGGKAPYVPAHDRELVIGTRKQGRGPLHEPQKCVWLIWAAWERPEYCHVALFVHVRPGPSCPFGKIQAEPSHIANLKFQINTARPNWKWERYEMGEGDEGDELALEFAVLGMSHPLLESIA